MTKEEWLNIWDYAATLKAAQPDIPVPTTPIPGRFISFLVKKVCDFWAKHRTKLVPFLTQVAIAALEALLAVQPEIAALNRKGPP